jgi:hypothetical protein
MNRPLFDPEHLRVAAKVPSMAWRRRWLNSAGAMAVLLILALGVAIPFIALVHIAVLLVR